MRHLILFAISLSGIAQTYVYDTDGRRVPLASPHETRERKVLEAGPGGRVVEESVERRDAQGNKMAPEKVRIFERKSPEGASIIETTTFRADLNGKMSPSERTVVTVQQQSGQTLTSTVVEQPGANGTLQVVEKIAAQTVAVEGKQRTNRSTYVLDANGTFIEAVRELIEKAPDGKGTKEVVQEFRNAPTGKMELTGQKVRLDQSNPDGSSTSEITIYGVAAQGRTAEGQLRIREQQLLSSKPGPGSTLVESISIRRPDLSDAKLGTYQKVGEKVIQLPKDGAGKP